MNNNRRTEFRQRITLNIRGCKFETFEETLHKYPETLLGSPEKRKKFYNPKTKEYCLDTDKYAFDAILFYYQSQGILSRPETVPEETFDKELTFYQLKEKESKNVSEEVTPNKPWRRKVWDLLENPESSRATALYARFSLAIVVISIITLCTETMYTSMNSINISSGNLAKFSTNSTSTAGSNEDIGKLKRAELWFVVDTCIVVWFTGEYLCRVFISPQMYKFITSALGVIDLFTIIPYFIILAVRFSCYNQAVSFTVLRVFRALRVLRLLKLTRYVSAMRILGLTVKSCKDQLKSLIILIFISVVAFSSAMYYAEHVENDEEFGSILAAGWYTVITMTTVGYGDVTPVTPLGKLVGSCCAVFGVLVMVSLPTPVFVLRFNEMYCKYNGMPRAGQSARKSFSALKRTAKH